MRFPIEEIAVGDYSPEYGHVASVTENNDYIYVHFVNGKSISMKKGEEIEFINGGRF